MKHMKHILQISILSSALLVLGCSSAVRYTSGTPSLDDPNAALTLGIDRVDFERAAESMIASMLDDPAFNKIQSGTRKVVAIGRIKNDTTQRIDTDLLTSKITIALRKSGKFILTTAVAAGGARDSMSEDVRELRANDEFSQKTIAKKGTLVAPDFSLAGKIIQRNSSLSKKTQQVDYYFQLTLTDLSTGLAYWEDEKVISKSGSNASVSW